MATQVQTVQRKPVQDRSPIASIVSGPSPARSSSKHQPRDEHIFISRAHQTGLRKRGQNVSSDSSTSAGSELRRDSWRATNSRSAASARSEQSLGILDYYLDPAQDDNIVDPAMKSFDFGLMTKLSSATSSPTKRSVEINSEGTSTPQRTSREHFLRMMHINRASQPKKRRAGNIWSQHDRRRSSLSICCQGQRFDEPYSSTCWSVPEMSPVQERKQSMTVSNRSRKDSAASVLDQRSPTDSRFTSSSWTSKRSRRTTQSSQDSQPPTSWSVKVSTPRLSDTSSVSQKRHRKLSSLFRTSASVKQRAGDTMVLKVIPEKRSLSSRIRHVILCS